MDFEQNFLISVKNIDLDSAETLVKTLSGSFNLVKVRIKGVSK